MADLLDHIGGLSIAFTAAARKDELPGGGAPSADGSRLEDGWRDRIAARLDELGEAWQDPSAYDGVTMAGPIEMPADQAALVALDEVTVHAWDLAAATGQPYPATRPRSRACHAFVAVLRAPARRCRRRRRSVRPAGRRTRRRTGPRPPHRSDRPRPVLDALNPEPSRFQGHVAARVPSPAVACPSGLRSTPRKRVWVQAHRGFKSHRHRQPCDVSGHPGQPDLRPVGSAGFVCRVCGGCLVRGVGSRARARRGARPGHGLVCRPRGPARWR